METKVTYLLTSILAKFFITCCAVLEPVYHDLVTGGSILENDEEAHVRDKLKQDVVQSGCIDVVKELQNEASKREMCSKVDLWKNYVGLLFDEIKVKSDLVYDKHSVELIGYCNLDKVGNQIMNFERIMKDTSITEKYTDADIAK
ncbi:Hypothetical predicted protein [Mytilus galloprovincialis]|uniref:Uncharacterized protein n=1 Tax=Mytilus galloprovincialis TaxID=29158 RepID=A0A8B6BMI5_MYTGA|nr:Hypothetical predicted protein [Mytilus galloprovincialis]